MEIFLRPRIRIGFQKTALYYFAGTLEAVVAAGAGLGLAARTGAL